jgi:hypothetical protein
LAGSFTFEAAPGEQYTITPMVIGDGTITPGTAMSYNAGDTPTYTFTPSAGYELHDVTVDGQSVLPAVQVDAYTFPALSSDHTITATFAEVVANEPATAGVFQVFFVSTDNHGFQFIFRFWNFENLRLVIASILTKQGGTEVTDELTFEGDDTAMYTWIAGQSPSTTEQTVDGDTVYTVTFEIMDGDTVVDTYTTTYTVTGDPGDQPGANDPDALQNLEAFYGRSAESGDVTLDLVDSGNSFTVDMTVNDSTMTERTVTFTATSALTDLYIDNASLSYDSGNDYYNILDDADRVQHGEPLRVVLTSYNFSGDAAGNGVEVKLYRASDGAPVRYNPIVSEGGTRNPDAPDVVVPVLVNKDSELYENVSSLSENKDRFTIMIDEKGDGVFGYREAMEGEVMFDVVDMGDYAYLNISSNHLTGFALQFTPPAAPVPDDDDNGDNCFIRSLGGNVPGSAQFVVLLMIAGIFGAAIVRKRR